MSEVLHWIYRSWRILINLLSWVATLLLLVVTLGLLTFQIPFVQQFFLQKALDRANSSVAGTLQAERLSGFIPFSIQLHNLSLTGNDFTPIVSIPEVRVQLDLTELLTGTIRVRSFRAIDPEVRVRYDSGSKTLDLVDALSAKQSESIQRPDSAGTDVLQNLYIPEFRIENGSVFLTRIHELGLSDSLVAEKLFVSLFYEASKERRIADLTELTASFPLSRQSLQVSGQVFQDNEKTEINGLRLRTFGSEVDLNAEIRVGLSEPLSLLGETETWLSRDFKITTQRVFLDSEELRYLGIPIPSGEMPEKLELNVQMSTDQDILYLNDVDIYAENSQARLSGEVNRTRWTKNLRLNLESLLIESPDFPEGSVLRKAGEIFANNRIAGTFSSATASTVSTTESLRGSLSLFQPEKTLSMDATFSSSDGWSTIEAVVNSTFDSLSWTLKPIVSKPLEWTSTPEASRSVWDRILAEVTNESMISGQLLADISFANQTITKAEVIGNISENRIGTVDAGALSFRSFTSGDTLFYEADGEGLGFQLSTKGSYPMTGFKTPLFFQWWTPESVSDYKKRNWPVWEQQTSITNLDLTRLFPRVYPNQTSLSLLVQSSLEAGFPEYGSGSGRLLLQNLVYEGNSIDDISVVVNLEHSSDSDSRFELRTSLGHVHFKGQMSPLSLAEGVRKVGQSFAGKISEQTFGLINLPVEQRLPTPVQRNPRVPSYLLDGDFTIQVSDLTTIGQLTGKRSLESSFSSKGTIRFNREKLDIESQFSDSLMIIDRLKVSAVKGSLGLLYFPDHDLTADHEVMLTLTADSLEGKAVKMEAIENRLSLKNDTLALTMKSLKGTDLTHLQFHTQLELKRDELRLDISTLQVGKGSYEWSMNQPAGITFARGDIVSFRSLQLTSQDQTFDINGTYSQAPGDSLEVGLTQIDLGQLSEFIPGRLTFDGIIAGKLTGTFPGGVPVIYGNLGINDFELNDRVVGDFSLSSIYDAEMERFNLQARLFTDTLVKEQVNGRDEFVGQDFVIEGFVRNPALTTPELPTFDLTARFNRIDLWILEELLPNIIVSSRGLATGSARLRDPVEEGADARLLLEGEAEVLNAELTPLFLNTKYSVTGNVAYSNRTGFRFNPLVLRESSGGEGQLTGIAALTSLDGSIPLALSLQMNQFQFINNPYNPDLPFYATVNGTGRLDLTGNSANPVLRTPAPILVTSNSRVSVPLLDVINVSQDNKFITFVDDFESWEVTGTGGVSRPRTSGTTPMAPSPDEFSFTDQFTMDLQFVAREPLRFEMIFDRITNEAINGNGTGQMRVTLQDGNYQLFGALDLSSGEYNFVSGDILTRRFQLEEGGRIVWDGDPTNAQLNVNAVYRARPPLATLGVVSASTADQLGTGQRIPIELVLQIFGSIDEIQNEFFFRLPSGITGFSDPTLSTRISSLNRNQEEKLVQAFSILLTGNFIPSGESTFENTSVLSGLTGSAVLINPFVSTQLLSPLLSNQINSLLNENVTFDVDVNIDAYNEVELAVALRLYNDRLVLRREGQITGDQNRLGDLGATYQINRILSLTAFHRQDPTFTTNTGQSSAEGGNNQVINGVGVEARFQFHTWKEFFRRLTAWLR